jgi:hypothetical protein
LKIPSQDRKIFRQISPTVTFGFAIQTCPKEVVKAVARKKYSTVKILIYTVTKILRV